MSAVPSGNDHLALNDDDALFADDFSESNQARDLLAAFQDQRGGTAIVTERRVPRLADPHVDDDRLSGSGRGRRPLHRLEVEGGPHAALAACASEDGGDAEHLFRGSQQRFKRTNGPPPLPPVCKARLPARYASGTTPRMIGRLRCPLHMGRSHRQSATTR